MPEIPGKRFELVNGELVEMPGASFYHGLIAALLYRLMFAFATERHLGVAVPDGVAYVLQRDPDVVRVPDASFVSTDRIPEGDGPIGFFPGAPDIAVEVVSPNDLAREIDRKVQHYLRAGTRIVWVVWTDELAVTVHTPDRIARRLESGESLDGGDVLPGFSVPVAELFNVNPRS
jgi:Uma2 family endonuclease